jgi:hypothetical protein
MPQISNATRDAIKNSGVRAVARETGLNPGTVQRALKTGKASATALAKLERIKGRLRQKDEFSGATPVQAPRRDRGVFSWSLETIRLARDEQARGQFKNPVFLARAMRTDDALFTAYHNRIAPQMAIEAKLVAAPGARGERACARAQTSCIVPKQVLAGIQGTLANHGVAIGYIEQEANEEGTRVDFKLTEWPLEFVRWDETKECLVTRVKDGAGEVPIVHGDGRWIVFKKYADQPWTQEACVLPGALLWAAHANGIKDWAAASTSHGQAKIVGELPDGMSLQNSETGALTPEASAFLAMLQDMVSGEVGAGIRPAGSKTDFLANGSTAWQVFAELILDRKKAAAYIYLGTDATLGAQGGAPGVDISALFGVATTKIQGDFAAIQDGLRSGFYEPWTAINEGDSRNAPTLVYQIPDTDSEQKIENEHARLEKFFAAIELHSKAGMLVDQVFVNALAARYKVAAPTLAPAAQKAVKLEVTPSDVAKVFSINEIRASQGGSPHPDPARGAMTIPQAEAADKAAADAAVKAAPQSAPTTPEAPAAPAGTP